MARQAFYFLVFAELSMLRGENCYFDVCQGNLATNLSVHSQAKEQAKNVFRFIITTSRYFCQKAMTAVQRTASDCTRAYMYLTISIHHGGNHQHGHQNPRELRQNLSIVNYRPNYANTSSRTCLNTLRRIRDLSEIGNT